MKRIIQKDIGIASYTKQIDLTLPVNDIYEMGHDSVILERAAMIAFNRRLFFSLEKDYQMMCDVYRLRFGNNPSKASLYIVQRVSDSMKMTARYAQELEETVIRKMAEEMISIALEKVDIVYQLEKSFWNRLKFLFISKI